MTKIVRLVEPSERLTVNDAFYNLPFRSLVLDRNGRKHEVKTRVMSHSGRHIVCRDYGKMRYATPFDDMLVEKIITTDREDRIYLRRQEVRI